MFVQGGFLEVQPHLVTVLADTAIRAKDLDEAKALEAKREAEQAMVNKTSKEEVAAAEGRARRRAGATRGHPQAAQPRVDAVGVGVNWGQSHWGQSGLSRSPVICGGRSPSE